MSRQQVELNLFRSREAFWVAETGLGITRYCFGHLPIQRFIFSPFTIQHFHAPSPFATAHVRVQTLTHWPRVFAALALSNPNPMIIEAPTAMTNSFCIDRFLHPILIFRSRWATSKAQSYPLKTERRPSSTLNPRFPTIAECHLMGNKN